MNKLTTNPEGMIDEGTYIVFSTEPVLKVHWLGLNIDPNLLMAATNNINN